MRARTTFGSILALLALMTVPVTASSQTSVTTPKLDFSGIIFGNYQYRTDSIARNALGGKSPNRFDIGRVYLNFRMPAGEKGSMRVTTDIFQNTGGGGYYAGWAVRLKYAYFQYDFTKRLFGVENLGALARVGMVHTVVIDHVDSYWARWLSQNALETHGFFASADVGAVSLVSLPNRRGEVYLTLTNGPGYTSAEIDRFKDVAARFSWTPFANDSGFLRTLAISPWYLKGRVGGAFAAGAPGATWTDGVQRDRRGVFVGVRERRFTGGAEFAQRVEELESGASLATRTVRSRTSNLMSAFAIVRPLELGDPGRRSRLGLFARWDDFSLDDVAATASSTDLIWGGVMWDLNTRSTISLDYQKMTLTSGPTSVKTPTNTLFLHWVTNF